MLPCRRLQRLISDRGLSQIDAAAKVGVTPEHLSRLLSGTQKPRPGLAERLSKLVGGVVTPWELVSGKAA